MPTKAQLLNSVDQGQQFSCTDSHPEQLRTGPLGNSRRAAGILAQRAPTHRRSEFNLYADVDSGYQNRSSSCFHAEKDPGAATDSASRSGGTCVSSFPGGPSNVVAVPLIRGRLRKRGFKICELDTGLEVSRGGRTKDAGRVMFGLPTIAQFPSGFQ